MDLMAWFVLARLVTMGKSEMEFDRPVLDINSLQFYDTFGDQIPLIMSGGYVKVACQYKEETHLLDPDYKKVGSNEKGPDTTTVLRLNITPSLQFGKYRCGYNGKISRDAFELNYRLCSEKEETCSECLFWDGRSTCMHTAKGTFPCDAISSGAFDPNWCPKETGMAYCGSDCSSQNCPHAGTVQKPWCQNMESRYRERLNQVLISDKCLLDSFPSISYRFFLEDADFYDAVHIEALKLNSPHINAQISCQSDSCLPNCPEMRVVCTVKDINGVVIKSMTDRCTNDRYRRAEIDMRDPVFNITGYHLFRFTCDVMNSTTAISRMTNTLVFFNGKVNIRQVHSDKDNRFTKSLDCTIDPMPSPPFRVDGYGWHRVNPYRDDDDYSEAYGQLSQDGKIPTFHISRDGSYYCTIRVNYMRCGLNQLIEREVIKSEIVKVVAPPAVGLDQESSGATPVCSGRLLLLQSFQKLIDIHDLDDFVAVFPLLAALVSLVFLSDQISQHQINGKNFINA